MPSKRSIVISLALICGLLPIACRKYTVVPPQQPAQPPTPHQPQLPRSVPPELLAPPGGNSPRLPLMQMPAARRNPWKPKVAARDWKHIVIHHTATSRGSVESIHAAHRKRRDGKGNPWRGIGYHFVIGNGNGMTDGAIEETFRWRQQMHGAHAGVGRYNQQGIGIVLVGNFEKASPTTAQLAAVKRLVTALKAEYRIDSKQVIGHSKIKATACPGKYFPLAEVSAGIPGATLARRTRRGGTTTLAELNRKQTR